MPNNPLPNKYFNADNDFDRLLSGMPTNAIRAKIEAEERAAQRAKDANPLTPSNVPVVALIDRYICRCGQATAAVRGVGRYLETAEGKLFQSDLFAKPQSREIHVHHVAICAVCLDKLPATYKEVK